MCICSYVLYLPTCKHNVIHSISDDVSTGFVLAELSHFLKLDRILLMSSLEFIFCITGNVVIFLQTHISLGTYL